MLVFLMPSEVYPGEIKISALVKDGENLYENPKW